MEHLLRDRNALRPLRQLGGGRAREEVKRRFAVKQMVAETQKVVLDAMGAP